MATYRCPHNAEPHSLEECLAAAAAAETARGGDEVKEVTVEMEYAKETPRTRVYKEIGNDQLIGTLYVPKSTLKYELGNAEPQKIQVVVRVLG